MFGAIVPNGSRACKGDEGAIFCPCPSPWAIKINSSFHDTILEIPKSDVNVPGADSIATIGPEMAINGTEPCGTIHGTKRHLVAILAQYTLLVCSSI